MAAIVETPTDLIQDGPDGSFHVRTQLYVSSNSAKTGGLDAVNDQLRSDGWTVYNSAMNPHATIGFGTLAEEQPAEFVIGKEGATEADAKKEVDSAVVATGNWSFSRTASTKVKKFQDYVGDVIDDPTGGNKKYVIAGLAASGAAVLLITYRDPIIAALNLIFKKRKGRRK
jgi:hypothetical protein